MPTPPDPRPPYPHEPTVPRPPYPHEPTVRRQPRPDDPTVRRPPASGPQPPPAAAEYRFGPGVPPSVNTGSDQAVNVWRGTERPDQQQPGSPARKRRRRLLGGWLLPAVVLIGVLAYLGWQRYAPALVVTGASVSTDPAGPACDGTAVVTGTLSTNGQAGTVEYRWRRSDGTVSPTLRQAVTRGAQETDVVLRWTFDGRGTLRATATLEVLTPDPTTASATFRYACR
jgi:hypothetical protein